MIGNIVVFCDWETKTEQMDALCKPVDIPFVPRIGDTLWFEVGGWGISQNVKSVEWWDTEPQRIEIHLEPLVVTDAESFLCDMQNAGWILEEELPPMEPDEPSPKSSPTNSR